jgi:shikimate kinase
LVLKTDGAGDARNIVLTGFMGTGKNAVGLILAERLGWRFVDTDVLVEERTGRTISDIFEWDGEAAFRRLERAACQEVAARREHVIATGGGATLDPENRAALTRGNLLVCLTSEPEEIARRLAGDETRPLLAGDPVARIRELLAARQPVYDALPHHVDTTHLSPEQVADEVMKLYVK